MGADRDCSTTDSDAEVDALVGAAYRRAQLHRRWDQQDELLRHARTQRWGRERPPAGTSRTLRWEHATMPPLRMGDWANPGPYGLPPWTNPDDMDTTDAGRERVE